jgi:acetyl esterase/lipase
MKNTTILLVCISLLLAGCATSPEPTPGPVQVSYIPDGDPRQVLDIYLPEGETGPYPILFVSTGVFLSESDLWNFSYLGDYFSQLGYAVVAVDYRRAPNNTYPTQFQDVFCALAWTYANADDYDLDTGRIIVLGESYGGMFSVMLGTIDDDASFMEGCPYSLPDTGLVQGVVGVDTIYDLTLPGSLNYRELTMKIIEPYMGNTLQTHPEIWAEASPITYVDGSEPPFLLISADATLYLNTTQPEYFAAALEAAGVEVDLMIIPDTYTHFLGIGISSGIVESGRAQAFEAMEIFMQDVLGE